MDIGYGDEPAGERDFGAELLEAPGCAEEKLDAALRLLAVASRHFELSPDPSFVADSSLRILHCNAAFLRLAGRDAGPGSRLGALYAGQEGEAFAARLRACLEASGFWEGETPRRCSGGTAGPERLTLAAVRGPAAAPYVGIIRDISELRRAEARLAYTENHDVLTGLPNRAQYLAAVDDLIAARRPDPLAACPDGREGPGEASSIAACLLDLDGFKRFNNDESREVGDDILRAVAGRLAESVRQADCLGRTGGDEFSLAFALEGGVSPGEIAERVLSVFDEPFRVRGRLYHLRASMGVALWPEHGSGASALAAAADLALQSRKAHGKRKYQVYRKDLEAGLVGSASLEGELRQAISAGLIAVHYQPILRLADGRIAGVEALARWPRPEGLVPPSRFIPLAEEAGLISELGERVLVEACSWRARLELPEARPFYVAVNCSARQLQEPGFPSLAARRIAELGLAPGQVVIEITESCLLGDLASARTMIEELRRTGARIYIDDFGVGFASLSYLKELPVDGVKIDQSFVAELESDPHSRGIVEAVAFLARELGIQTVAEGVETEGQLAAIREIGCDYAQGFLVSRALPAGEIERFVAGEGRRAPSW